MTRLLIVDDHAIVRAGVRRLLSDMPDLECDEVETGEAALAAVEQGEASLVILDLNLPGLGGVELIRRLRLARSDVKVLVFSTHSQPVYAVRALEAGARAYVSKNAAPEELARGVRAVLAGRTYIEAEVAEELGGQQAPFAGDLRPLTDRDLEIMRLLSQGRSLSQIADILGVAYKTVANTMSAIKEKLGVTQTADLIRLALDRGLA